MNQAVKIGVEDAEPRDEILYARVKARNKRFVEALAATTGKNGTSVSVIVDSVLDRIRAEVGDRNGSKPKRRVR